MRCRGGEHAFDSVAMTRSTKRQLSLTQRGKPVNTGPALSVGAGGGVRVGSPRTWRELQITRNIINLPQGG